MNRCQVEFNRLWVRCFGLVEQENRNLIPPVFGLYSGMSGTAQRQDRFFHFLRKLRCEGRSNMYGAIPYLMRSFALDRDSAFTIVCQWMDRQLEIAPPQSAESKRRKAARRRAA